MDPNPRRFEGDETWFRLLNWTKDQKASERLAAAILLSEGYRGVDPSHPLGGQDGGKDMLCLKDGLKIIGAAYFPRGQQEFKDIKEKFLADLQGVNRNGAAGISFITNQELRLGERKSLQDMAGATVIDLYHLERLTLVLNSPKNYGIRMEFLALGITQEEYVSFIASRDSQQHQRLEALENRLVEIAAQIQTQTSKLVGLATGGETVAYFLPSRLVGADFISLHLLIDSTEHPAYDISGYYVDLDERINADIGGVYLKRQFHFPQLFPGRMIHNALMVSIGGRKQVRLNLFYSTRTKGVIQEIRIILEGERLFVGNRVMVDGRPFKTEIMPDFPGYNPENSDSIFR